MLQLGVRKSTPVIRWYMSVCSCSRQAQYAPLFGYDGLSFSVQCFTENNLAIPPKERAPGVKGHPHPLFIGIARFEYPCLHPNSHRQRDSPEPADTPGGPHAGLQRKPRPIYSAQDTVGNTSATFNRWCSDEAWEEREWNTRSEEAYSPWQAPHFPPRSPTGDLE